MHRMNRTLIRTTLIVLCSLLLWSCQPSDKQVVILFTNDTHSQITPIATDASRNAGMGGVERRKVLIDSLRSHYPEALLVDAGDAVQGTPYFNLYAGKIETLILNELGYDVRTVGNHEFDNGSEALAALLSTYNGVTVSSNYTYHNTHLQECVTPSWMCNAGGVKVGFIGLNVDPHGLLFTDHARDITYHDPIAIADSLALQLRNQGADIVVALSHLGYIRDKINGTNVIDSVLIENTHYIDMVIGGHSHSYLTEARYHKNLDGKSIAVGQTGKSGVYLGFAHITIPADKKKDIIVDYRLLPVDARYDNRLDNDFATLLQPYKMEVDSVMNIVIGTTLDTLYVAKPESPLSNWACDAFADMARRRTGDAVDFAILNTGGIRADITPREVTRGEIWASFPFSNVMSVLKMRGSDVEQLFAQIANNGGEGVSREVRLDIEKGQVASLTIGGRPIDKERIYTVATLNFVADGGDGMAAFTQAIERKDYPGFVYELFEGYVNELTHRGANMTAHNDGRITIIE